MLTLDIKENFASLSWITHFTNSVYGDIFKGQYFKTILFHYLQYKIVVSFKGFLLAIYSFVSYMEMIRGAKIMALMQWENAS
jgi:hypothetical protein